MSTLINYPGQNGALIRAELFQPSGGAARGAVVIAHGADGLVDNGNGLWATFLRDHAESLAVTGLVALIPMYFEATQTLPGSQALLSIPSHRDDWQAALDAALDVARGLAGVPAGKIGLLGYSLGGHLCLRLSGSVRAVVAYFAPLLSELGGLGAGGGSGLAAQLHQGDADSLVPLGAVREIERQLLASGTRASLFTYVGATHGFGTTSASDVNARQQAKQRMLAFFGKEL